LFFAALLTLGLSIMFKKGVFDPANKGRDPFELCWEEMKYAAQKLGFSDFDKWLFAS